LHVEDFAQAGQVQIRPPWRLVEIVYAARTWPALVTSQAAGDVLMSSNL
jgi:hypothetical protein